MTKTISINLGGVLFQIDDKAFTLLQNYLNAIERQFPNRNERAEIMDDIERRLAELFKDRLNESKNLVNVEDVNQAISIMGEPDAFTPTDGFSHQQSGGNMGTVTKRLYRDADDRMLGGVCSGLGAYFDTAPWLFRGLFMAFTIFFLSGALIYLILWLILPEAVTAAQKLEMRGKPITIENIKESVKNEFNNVRDRMKF